MPFVDPKNLRRPLALTEIHAMITRGEADADAGRVSDLDELLAEWDAEDRAACQRSPIRLTRFRAN